MICSFPIGIGDKQGAVEGVKKILRSRLADINNKTTRLTSFALDLEQEDIDRLN